MTDLRTAARNVIDNAVCAITFRSITDAHPELTGDECMDVDRLISAAIVSIHIPPPELLN